MNLKEVKVKGLFGYLSYTIEVRKGEWATLVHGPNGTGKTTILKMIDDFSKLNFSSFFAIH